MSLPSVPTYIYLQNIWYSKESDSMTGTQQYLLFPTSSSPPPFPVVLLFLAKESMSG